jgi:hypothetical protein
MKSLGTKPDFLSSLEHRVWKMVIGVACGEPAPEQLRMCLGDICQSVRAKPYLGNWFQMSK